MKSYNIKLIIGIIILVSLCSMNIMYTILGDNIVKKGARNSPPSISLFQNLLYDNQLLEVEVTDIFSQFDSNKEIIDSNTVTYFKNIPIRTAKVNTVYSYLPSNDRDIEFSIISAPYGYIYEDNLFKWNPDKADIGKHAIVLNAYNPTLKTNHTIEYNLYVNETNPWFGTDSRGNHIGGLLLKSSKWSLIPGIIASLFGVVLAIVLGAFSGYKYNVMAKIINGLTTVIEAIPALIIIFLTAVISGFNIYIIMIATGIVLLPSNIHTVQQIVREFVNNQFVESALEIGFKGHVVLWRDIIWFNCKSTIILQFTYCFAFAIVIEVTLSYLQIGVQPPDVSWGTILYEGRGQIVTGNYWMTLFPSLIIVLSILGLYMTGESLSKMVNHHYRK